MTSISTPGTRSVKDSGIHPGAAAIHRADGTGVQPTILTNNAIDDAPAEVALEARAFSHWYDNTAEELLTEFESYADCSRMLGCWTKDQSQLLGILRYTIGRQKTLDDLAGPPWHLEPAAVARRAGLDPRFTVDVATFAVDRTAAGSPAADRLCFGLFQIAVGAQLQAITAMLDDRILQLLAKRGIQFQLLPGTWPAEYLGSPSTSPVYCRIDEMLVEMAQHFPDRLTALAA
ncbi:MAG: hypothetical protein ACOYEV_16295 [Candidatus Nanopelagicales bacterium]